MSLPPDYFERLYSADADPWGFASRWYEQRKYALTLAALPDPIYQRGVEIGSSIGVLTTALAGRCRDLIAVEASAAALDVAGARVPANVELCLGSVPDDWPAGRYDLVVLSEVGYYLDRADLRRLLDLIIRDAAPGATILACHWRHPAPDYPLTGDQVHEEINRRWPRISRIEEEDFLLDVLDVRAPGEAVSVARRTGLLR